MKALLLRWELCISLLTDDTEGEILATFAENTRDFLYPGLNLIPHTPGSEREVLMKKSASFPVCISSAHCAVCVL